MSIYREKVIACERGGTFKYFLPRELTFEVWRRLEAAYGPLQKDPNMKTIAVESERFIFRATYLGNPITVFRKRLCTNLDITEFHRLIGYDEADG